MISAVREGSAGLKTAQIPTVQVNYFIKSLDMRKPMLCRQQEYAHDQANFGNPVFPFGQHHEEAIRFQHQAEQASEAASSAGR